MATPESALPRNLLTPARAILYGALVVGFLDAMDAVIFFGLRGATPIRIFQSIASGLLGRASFSGGLAAAFLGIFLHFFIALGIVSTYYVVSRKIGALTRHPAIYGPLYGVLVYGVMNLVVVPLSGAGRAPLTLPVFLNGIGIHILGVGLPCALVARRGA